MKKDIRKVIKDKKKELLEKWKHETWFLFFKYVKVWVK